MVKPLLLAILGLAAVSASGQATAGLPAPQLFGSGAPSYACSTTNYAYVSYVQRDATNGRLWICDDAVAAGTFAWDHLSAPQAVATSAAMNAVSLALGGCTTSTVTIPGATVGVNAAFASPVGMPTSSASTAGLVNVTAFVSAANTVTVSVCAVGLTALLASLTTAAVPYKVQLY